MAVFWVLFDAGTDQPYIKKSTVDGSLAFYDIEEEAAKAKRAHPGTDYKRVEYVPVGKFKALLEAANDIVTRHDKVGTVLTIDIESLADALADGFGDLVNGA